MWQLVSELKTVKRRLISNMLLPGNALNRLIAEERLRYEYVEGKYLNLWYEEWNISRLLFYITESDDYQPIQSDRILICDLFFSKVDEKGEKLIDLLLRQGFVTYAVYHKWKKEKIENASLLNKSFAICEQKTINFYDFLCGCFDRYSDYVPEQGKFEIYLQDKTCYLAVDKETGDTVGGMVVSSKDHICTEEFIFIDTKMRRRGIASELHKYWYEINNGCNCKFIVWIRDDNEASKKLHIKYRYEKQNSYKITLKKERQKNGREDYVSISRG